MSKPFHFKQFTVHQDKAAMKVGTDAVLLGAWCSLENNPDTILDIGAGTGVIALMLAQRSDAMTIDAVEIEERAYEQCVENFEQSDWGDRLFCYHSSFQYFVTEMEDEEEKYDLIISNPPFYKDNFQTSDKARNQARFESALSFEDLLDGVSRLLEDEGVFAVVLPYKELDGFVKQANSKGLFLNKVCKVKGNPNSDVVRCMLKFSFESSALIEEVLIIEEKRGVYTRGYVELCNEFYLKM